MVGVDDVNDDGEDDALIRVDAGAATDDVGIFYVRDRRINQIRRGRIALELIIGGTNLAGSGARCVDVDRDGKRELIVTGASSRDGRHWLGTRRIYEWRGHLLALRAVRQTDLVIHAPSETTRLRNFFELACGDALL